MLNGKRILLNHVRSEQIADTTLRIYKNKDFTVNLSLIKDEQNIANCTVYSGSITFFYKNSHLVTQNIYGTCR